MNLSNKEIEKLLTETLQDIKNKLIQDNDEEIEKYLIPNFNKLQQEDQQVFISYITKNYSEYNFINNQRFQNQELYQSKIKIMQVENQKELYLQLIKLKEWNLLINKFKDQNFCKENNIPDFWVSDESIKVISNNKEILPKLLELIQTQDYQQGYNYLNQIIIWFQLLSDIFYDKELNKLTIEKMIGQSIGKQIIYFYEYKEILQQIKPKEFETLMEAVRLTQFKKLSNYDISQLDIYCQVCYIVQTRLIDKQFLEDYLKKVFQISEQQIDFKVLENQVLKLIFQSNKIQELYFILMFYFINQYCSQLDFKNDYNKLEQIITYQKEDEQKEKIIKLHCKKVMNKSDSIYQFLLQQLISLKYLLHENQFLEEFKNYQNNQIGILKQLEKIEINLEFIFNCFNKDESQTLNLLRKVPLIQILKLQPSDQRIQAMILIFGLLLRENQENIFQMINSAKNRNLFQCTQQLLEKKFEFQQSLINLFLLIGVVYNHPLKNLYCFINLFQIDNQFQKAEFIQNICYLINLIKRDSNFDLNDLENIIQKLSHSNEEWEILDKIFDKQEIAEIYEQLFEFYLNHQLNQLIKQFLYQTLQKFKQLNEKKDKVNIKPFQVLIDFLSFEEFDLVGVSINKSMSSDVFEKVSAIIFQLLEKNNPTVQKDLLEYLKSKSVSNVFDYQQVNELLLKGKNLQFIQHLLTLKFYSSQPKRQDLIKKAISLFEEDSNTYQQIFNELDQFNIFEISPEYLQNSQKFESLPKNVSISLEDFNIFLQEISEDEKEKLVNNWLEDMKNPEKFRQLIPLYFNVIKRKEHSNNFLSLLSKNKIQTKEVFNMKALFQILYNNSNDELKQMLLKLQCIIYPIPFLYSNPNLEDLSKSQKLFNLNEKLIFVFPQCFPIINFSLSKKQNSFGKTSLINQIFYQGEIFEVNENCKLNQNTIDIMFDYCFSGSRNLAVADVHGIIPFEVMIKILPLFKFCIIQMDSEDELQENYEQFKCIKQNIQKWNPECCFIIRNSKTKDNKQLSQLEIEIQNEGISLHKMIDLTQKGLDRQKIYSEIESLSQFIFGKIKGQKSNLIDSKDFLTVLQNYYGQNHLEIEQIQKDNELLESLMNELQHFINDVKGFYSEDAFPMRSIMWQIKKLKQEQYQFDGKTRDQQIQQVESIRAEINRLEGLIPNTRPTKILDLFQQIFHSKDFYNLYLKFTDHLRKFNEQNTYQLQEENQKINEDLQEKKQEKKQRYLNQNYDVKDINESIKKLKNKLEQNLQQIQQRNIGIELFWRELIQIKQQGQSAELKINPAEIVANMVKKGEPFEFLDGDQLQIDTKFLVEFISHFPDSDQQKVLVLSVLGPQSSGKSTILNKIFGCHFWTSVGRCTKGIYFQLLKIAQKSQFDYQFDYVLILDTEGLQNPNQTDPEFDKKIALFILAISDIIIINVKGDIHQQFKNLVEMCIFTLGQMKNCISSVKQLIWCFNQNNDCNNYAPFLDQIQSIVNNLNLQVNNTDNEHDNSNFDYNEVLDLKKENIKILGFAQTEKSWRINSNTGIYEEWRQLIVNESFSEEAYNFGIQIIQQFVKKLKTQQENSISSLSSFVQNVESNWQSICRLPELLEFTELLQYKQDQSMKNKYEQLLTNQKFDYQTQISRRISEQVFAEKRLSLEFFESLERKEKQLIQQEKEQIKQNIESELQKYKTENKIINKICKKYIKQLDDHLQTYEYNCHIALLDEINKYKRKFQQIKGFKYLEDSVEKIRQNVELFQNLKGNKELIQQQLNQIWTKIISEAKEQQEQVFQDYSYALFKAIYSSFTQYQYNSQNQKSYEKFFSQMSKTSPNKQNYNEKQTIFDIYIQEIQSQQQFQIIFNNNNQNIKYNDFFCQPFSDRFKRSDQNYVVDLNNFYQSKCSFQQCTLQNFTLYLKSDKFFEDFKQFFNKQKQLKFQNIYTNKEQIINQVIGEFICILDYCQIQYDKEKLDELKKHLTEDQKGYQIYGDKVDKYFKDFQNSFDLNRILIQVIEQPEFTRNISYYYPSLKCKQIELSYKNVEDYQNQLKQNNQDLLFLLNKKYEPKQKDHYETFSFIADQKNNLNILKTFNSQIIQQFSEIMTKNEGWQRIYSEIYDIIKQKMIKIKNQIDKKKTESDSENEETLTFDNYLVKQIMAIIEQKILEFNKQFANFGVILSFIGELLIYYYSMFVIWRFSCYSKWKLIEKNLQELDQMKNEQLNRFKIAIEQKKTEQSISNAQVFAKSIKSGFLDRFYSAQLQKVQQSIDSMEQKCSDYVKRLDQRLLENYQKAKQNNIQDQEILDYILDQKGSIEKSVDKLIKEKEEELQKEYQQKLRQELKIFLKQVLNNIEIIYNITRQQQEILKSEDYFQINDDDYKKQEQKKEDYDSKLFLLICQCIQGEKLTKEQLQNINRDLMLIFTQNYESIKNPIFVRMFNDSEKRIPLLKPFIQELHKLVEEEIQNSSQEPLIFNNLQTQGPLNKVKLSLVGCLHSCPFCKRKCDQQSDQNHKHSCSNGHQLRGMNGVLINNRPSLLSCEEIEDDSLILTPNSNIQQKWSEVKKAYPEWNFRNLDDQKVIRLKEKMKNIWNSGIGQLVCQQQSQKLNIDIKFFQKNDFYDDKSQSIHYIIMLDNSGSMTGQRWEKVKKGVLQCMKEIGKNGEAKVSVIIFNSEARVVIDCEKVEINKQKDLFTYTGGGTCFNNAFLKAYDQLIKHENKKFDKNVILFYTDGGDSYPAEAVNKFCYLPNHIKKTLQLVSCSEGNHNQIVSIQQLTDNFNKSGISAESKANINVIYLEAVWVEVVNQNYHSCKF